MGGVRWKSIENSWDSNLAEHFSNAKDRWLEESSLSWEKEVRSDGTKVWITSEISCQLKGYDLKWKRIGKMETWKISWEIWGSGDQK